MMTTYQRKVIGVASSTISYNPPYSETSVIVICDDGTAWSLLAANPREEWVQLKSIPGTYDTTRRTLEIKE